MAAPIILCDTAGMTNERWLDCRMHGPKGNIPFTVGGSDVATIFGLSPWTTPLELWMIKIGRAKPQKKLNSNQLTMGHQLEPLAAYWFEQMTGNKVQDDTNLYQHADHPYALANFDRRFTRSTDGKSGILECKSCTYHNASHWPTTAIPSTTSCSCGSTWLWPTWTSEPSPPSGGTIPTPTWPSRSWNGTRPRRT